MARNIEWYGWRPQLPDYRDHVVNLGGVNQAALPTSVDLSTLAFMPSVYDQGQLGSCTANAIAGAIEFDQRKQKPAWDFVPSRLFIYYNERVMEGSVSQDAGAEIRDGIKSVNQLGCCPENKYWPYDITKFAVQPPAAAYKDAVLHKSLSYASVPQTAAGVKTVVASGFPVVFGFTVYDSFESDQVAQTGVLNMPTANEQVVGGHAVSVVGYDDTTQRVKCRNSWGTGWGINGTGYFTMPYQYLFDASLCSDFWVIKSVINP